MNDNRLHDVFIVDALRTPTGRYRGAFSGIRADHLAAVVLQALVDKTGLEAAAVDDVIMGNVTQVGEQSANIARTALLSAGWPEVIPGLTIDRKCGSGEEAVHVAAGMIAAGIHDVVIAGGAENMTRVTMGSNRSIMGEAFGKPVLDRFEMVSQGEAAERIADKWNLSRQDLDAFGAESQARASKARKSGYFDREIVPVDIRSWIDEGYEHEGPEVLSQDETIRPGTTIEKLATLKTPFRENGKISAGNASQISDGASALVLMSGNALRQYALKPRARLRAMTTVGSDPTLMLTGPIAATQKVLDQAGLSTDDIDLFEVNEAFAPVPMIWMQEHNISTNRLNVNGGAIALGHPLGASGARIMTTLLHELERRDATLGLQSICCAGGMATATIIERV
ncbi:thiolase family protein [Litorimonas sp.]|uniref:thiolase family protein n=1 Tax=Litorimonas sp. TaxID=1892381 RepID=UPI003A89C9A0